LDALLHAKKQQPDQSSIKRALIRQPTPPSLRQSA
jgi:hypothetical protein